MVGARACFWFVLALGLAVAMRGDGGAPASAPAPALDCTSVVAGLIDCLDFAKEGSNITKPNKDCCSEVKGVVKDKAKVKCLCDVYKNGDDFGIKINMSRALALPSSCGVSAPSISSCGKMAVGAPAPAVSPSPSAGGPTSAGGPASAAAGGVGVPSPTPGTSASARNWIPSYGHFVTVVFALCFYHWL